MDELNYNGFSNEENEIKSFGELNNTTGENVDANINGDVVENAAQYAASFILPKTFSSDFHNQNSVYFTNRGYF